MLVQGEEAAEKRSNAASFGGSATAATNDVSEAVARFSGEHLKGCSDLKEFLASAEAAARAASVELSAAAAQALKEVTMGGGRGTLVQLFFFFFAHLVCFPYAEPIVA